MRATAWLQAPTMVRPSGENSPVFAFPSSSHSITLASVPQTLASPPEDTVSIAAPPGASCAESTGPGWRATMVSMISPSSERVERRAVPSKEAVRQHSGEQTICTESLFLMPASSRVADMLSTRRPSRKRTATNSPVSCSTASRRRDMVSLGLARTVASFAPLPARQTCTVSSRCASSSSSSSLARSLSSASSGAPASSARSTKSRRFSSVDGGHSTESSSHENILRSRAKADDVDDVDGEDDVDDL
mmetsp:Transcript_21422/g.54621  ORF Transcript_21422/g.54621 Transcript_21422/m.54621 type:complete len:247 (+) Transcript_21422:897-1637(+)